MVEINYSWHEIYFLKRSSLLQKFISFSFETNYNLTSIYSYYLVELRYYHFILKISMLQRLNGSAEHFWEKLPISIIKSLFIPVYFRPRVWLCNDLQYFIFCKTSAIMCLKWLQEIKFLIAIFISYCKYLMVKVILSFGLFCKRKRN